MNAASSAPATNVFSGLPTAGFSTTPTFTFGQQTPQAQEQAPTNPFAGIKVPEENAATPTPALFGSVKTPAGPASAPAEDSTPKRSLFDALSKPSNAVATPIGGASAAGFNILGAAQKNDSSAQASDKPMGPLTSWYAATRAQEASKPRITAPASSNGSLFASMSRSQDPPSILSENAFKLPPNSRFNSPSKPATAPATDTTTQPATTEAASSPFSGLPAPSGQRSNMFAPPKEQAPASSPSMPTLTGTTASTDASGPELPKVPKAHVPKEWDVSSVSDNQNSDNLYNLISNLTMQLQQLNDKYRAKLISLSPTADWSALSLWHHQRSSAIKTKIDIAKKQRAAAKGVTGTESMLSTKRKVTDESAEDRDASPSKRARPADPPAAPTPEPTTPTPTVNPPATATSDLFAKVIGNKPSTSTGSSSLFAPQAAETSAPEPSKSAAPAKGFLPWSTPSSATGTSQSQSSAGGFKPTTSSTSSSFGGGFKPSATSGGSGFASQFAAKAKTYDELAAERKKKAMEADYDSDDETKEEWSAKYDKKEAERIAKQKEAAASVGGFSMPVAKTPETVAPVSGFTMPAAKKTPDGPAPVSGFTMPATQKTADTSAPASNPFAKLPKPASGAATPGLLGSRAASPAPPSVFNAGSTAQRPASNIFGHLSSGASSNNQEESDEEGEQAAGSADPSTPPKRKFGASETEADDSNDDTSRYKKQDTAKKGSLLSRMTRDEGSESEKENNDSGSVFGQTNGSTTPAGKPRSYFDFGAAAAKASTTPKSDTFVGDQTYKEGTPLKFSNPPSLQFTDIESTTPKKPPPANPPYMFGGPSFLAPNAGLSAPSSVFSSRAATPTEADTSAASAAEDDEESSKLEQVDLSKLTAEEKSAFDVVFETEAALAKHQVDRGDGTKTWESFARGPLYILKDKDTGKCFVRIRIASGATPLNHSILPKLTTSVSGSSGKMVMVTMPKKEYGIAPYFLSFKTGDDAKSFSESYNESLPS